MRKKNQKLRKILSEFFQILLLTIIKFGAIPFQRYETKGISHRCLTAILFTNLEGSGTQIILFSREQN